jgi:hypothetical protein
MLHAVLFQLRRVLYCLEGGRYNQRKYDKNRVLLRCNPLHTACRSRYAALRGIPLHTAVRYMGQTERNIHF